MPVNNLLYANSYQGYDIIPEPELGNRSDILSRFLAILLDMTGKHCRVFAVRFELRFPDEGFVPSPDNRQIVRFMEAYADYFKAEGLDYAYLWVREQDAGERRQHYHVVLLLDGNRTRSFYGGHMDHATDLWNHVLRLRGYEGLVHLCLWSWELEAERPYALGGGLMLARTDPGFEEAFRTLFKRVSYLAKARTKTGTPPGKRMFGASLLG
jgi:hypothetical protein